jgi:hypothetical protein
MRWLSVVVGMLLGLGCASSGEPSAEPCEEPRVDLRRVSCFPTSEPTGTFGAFVVDTDSDREIVAVRVRFRAADGADRGAIGVRLEELQSTGCDGAALRFGSFRFSAPAGPLVRDDGTVGSICEVCDTAETWAVEIEVIQRDAGVEETTVHDVPEAVLRCDP